jgi:hypothetical protein
MRQASVTGAPTSGAGLGCRFTPLVGAPVALAPGGGQPRLTRPTPAPVAAPVYLGVLCDG